MKKIMSFALCSLLLCNTYTATNTTESAIPAELFGETANAITQGLIAGSQICIGVLAAYSLYKIVAEYLNKGPHQIFKAGTIPESFDSVAGNDPAKDALQDIVQLLKDPIRAKAIGARIPKGILLEGASGTGKTLLARALAGEANCSFIAVSGSEFEEIYVGVGAARIRALFNAARALKAPCIIFIDEIDALIGDRNTGGMAGAPDRAQTLNEFLHQVDGFTPHTHPIIIVGATNRAHAADPAALRPGRFDRIIHVGLPDVNDREKILILHAQKIRHGALNFRSIAEKTEGLAGAHLANIINEAALLALKKGKMIVDQADLETATEKMMQQLPQPYYASHYRSLAS